MFIPYLASEFILFRILLKPLPLKLVAAVAMSTVVAFNFFREVKLSSIEKYVYNTITTCLVG